MEKTLEQTGNNAAGIFRIVFFGPESTGKTTLATALAERYNEPLVPEFMREYFQKKLENGDEKLTKEDLLPIAKGQMNLENSKLKMAENLLFCDTNLLELKVYSEYYNNGFCPSEINEAVLKNHYDIYLLTYIDVPWIPDGQRDRPDNRLEMFRIFESELKKNNLPYHILKGSQEKRMNKAVALIDEMLKKR